MSPSRPSHGGSWVAAYRGMLADNIKGLVLALFSSIFIGASFIVKKKGLKKGGASVLRPAAELHDPAYAKRYFCTSDMLNGSINKLLSEVRKVMVESYVALRRGDTTPGSRVAYRMTVRQLEALIKLSEAIARSHFDKVVLSSHVRMAVRLLKTSIISVKIDLSDFQNINYGDADRGSDPDGVQQTATNIVQASKNGGDGQGNE